MNKSVLIVGVYLELLINWIVFPRSSDGAKVLSVAVVPFQYPS